MDNIFENIPDNHSSEIFETIVNSKNVRIERILSFGPDSCENKWYDQDESEWIIIIKGKAKLIFEEDSIILSTGDYYLIKPHVKHKVEILEKVTETLWLAVFFK